MSKLTSEPDHYVVAYTHRYGFPATWVTDVSLPQPTLNQARESTLDSERGGVILAVWPDGTVTAVEARRTMNGLREKAPYPTSFVLAQEP